MAYYIEYADSDSIEMQEPLSESEVIDTARSYSDKEVNSFNEALAVLRKAGYMVFEDC